MTVLDKQPITTITNKWGVVFTVLVILLLVSVILAIATFFNTTLNNIAIVGIVLSFIGLACAVFFAKDVPTGTYEYTVTIDDEVTFKEVYDKYEIVDQKGQLYILRDRED